MENGARYSGFRDTVAYRAGTWFMEHGFAVANWLGQVVAESSRSHFNREYWLLYVTPPLPRPHWWSRSKKPEPQLVAHVLFDSYEADDYCWLIEVYGSQHLERIESVAATVAAAEGSETSVIVRLATKVPHNRGARIRM